MKYYLAIIPSSICLLLVVLFLWLNYVIQLYPTLVVRISPFTEGVIRAQSLGELDEAVFVKTVKGWNAYNVEACYEIYRNSNQPDIRLWAVLAIGHAGKQNDIERLESLLKYSKSKGDTESINFSLALLGSKYEE